MSQDQKPRPVKAVTIAGEGAGQVASVDTMESMDAAVDAPTAHEAGSAPRGSGGSLLSAILFLLACVAGGAGLTALPHLMPELAERLYGARP